MRSITPFLSLLFSLLGSGFGSAKVFQGQVRAQLHSCVPKMCKYLMHLRCILRNHNLSPAYLITLPSSAVCWPTCTPPAQWLLSTYVELGRGRGSAGYNWLDRNASSLASFLNELPMRASLGTENFWHHSVKLDSRLWSPLFKQSMCPSWGFLESLS